MSAEPERRMAAYVACLALAVVCCACACGSAPADHAAGAAQQGAVITVGSFDFPESVLLADIYADALTTQGFPVRVLPNLGPRELVDPALMSGLVQVVPEYSGSALEFVSLGRRSATSDVTATGRALAGWVAGRGLVAGLPSAAQDANVIVVTAATAARYGLRSVADLARVAPRLAFGGPPECPERIYCLLGLKQVYGLRFRVFIPLDAGGPLTLQALEAGDIGVALLFSTDPAITADHLVVLADDRGLQPAENVVPLVHRDAVARYGPRLLAVLDTVSARLTTGSLRALNARVELRGDDPRLVAESWLRAQGLASAGVRHIEREGGEGSRVDWHGEPCAGSGCAADAGPAAPDGCAPAAAASGLGHHPGLAGPGGCRAGRRDRDLGAGAVAPAR